MTKILLVEDDKSLREIYGVRLLAEGYDIVSAGDGEEALAMAIKERPQLIVSDVMMPKISGFDMLDILRSTTETKDIKVIMMTALNSEDQRERGESLGADRYLVKSQVGIEDVVRTVHEVLGDAPVAGAASGANVFTQPSAPRPATPGAPTPAQPPRGPQPSTPTPPNPQPATPAAAAASPQPTSTPPAQAQPAPSQAPAPGQASSSQPQPNNQTQPPRGPQPATATPPNPPQPATPAAPPHAQPTPPQAAPTAPAPASSPTPAAPTPHTQPQQQPNNSPDSTSQASNLPQPTAPFSTNRPAGLGDRIIHPIDNPAPKRDFGNLMEQELHGNTPTAPVASVNPAPNITFEETPLPPRPAGPQPPQQ